MQMVNYGAAFGISNHPDDFYNGDYYSGDNWAGQPHFFNADGAHFYWLGDDFSGFWQLDYNDQTWNDEIQDLYDGGYFYCDEGPMGCQNYDESGEAVYSFTSGDITFTLGGAGCMGIWVDHPTDDWYDGYYYEAEQWDGQPHYTDGMGAHLYWLDGEDYGYWQFDFNDQTGAYPVEDLFDGGYMYQDGEWYSGEDNYDSNGYAEYEFTTGTVSF
jgi:hypothetical protein